MSLDFWPPAPDLRRDEISFTYQGNDYLGHLVAPAESAGPRPLVLVVHNYQGLKQFDIDVAEYMARLGYVGLAVDAYGNDVPADDREFPVNEASRIPEYQKRAFEAMVRIEHDFNKLRGLLSAWIEAGMAHPTVSNDYQPAVIGYCFGGMVVIECVRGGLPISGGVSFHGLLQTAEKPDPPPFDVVRPPIVTAPNPYNTEAVLVIENGAEDQLVPFESQQRFFAEMDEAGVNWCFHNHAKTPHGFALAERIGPPGRLYEPADRRSTQHMLDLFRELFAGVPQNRVEYNAAGTSIP